MRIIAQRQESKRDLQELISFLAGCRAEARRDGRFRVAHISLRVAHIDPLAVLESIFEPDELHFYLERSGREEAIAGADGVVSLRVSGTERFQKAKAFVADTLERTICIGDMDAAYAGPHFFCAFGFFDEEKSETPFPGATVFLPRWQVARQGENFSAAANLRIDAESDVASLAEKVWRAHGKFSSFDYGEPAGELVPIAILGGSIEKSSTRREVFEEGVRKGLAAIERGDLRKVVLGRALDLDLPAELNPLHALNRLRMAHSNCFTYSVANGSGQSFIGASPELLVKREGDRLRTEALAGSAPRGATAPDDAALAEQLLRSEKDGREHRLVIDSIRRRLEQFPVEVEIASQPRLLQLANVQHLRTPVTGQISGEVHLLDVLAQLHPTPAVGGTPREPARELIRELEDFPRGLYAGAIGWINGAGDGEFTVAIRSTLIDGLRARLYAGAGIVAGSDPGREWEETEVKLRAMLGVLSADGPAA